jgi:hypothetical protein
LSWRFVIERGSSITRKQLKHGLVGDSDKMADRV